uniref:Uncharacterized protein n=1 Tax=Meloidogyne floridensis TaxID=298350 RepID=A0A915NX72_9BILA
MFGIEDSQLDFRYASIFFKENSPYDEKTNKIWEKLSGFIIAKSVDEIKEKLKILIVQAKKNNKRANNKKEKRKNNKKINENENNNNIENNINKLIKLINKYEEIEQKLNKLPEEINWKELEKMANFWMIFNKIKDSKDFEKENFDNDLNEENEDNSVYKSYIQDLHKKEILALLPEEWIEIKEIEKIQKQSVLYRYLNATKEVKEIMNAKHIMRELLGENLYILELKQPILFRLGIEDSQLDFRYVNIFFNDKNSPYDEKTNKIWEKLSGFIIAKSDSKDFEKENFDSDLNEEILDSSVYKDYIQDLHKKEILALLPEEWIEINEIEKLQKQNVLYRYLNATKEVKEIMSAKHKMRELLGENLYVLELKQPTLFRLDLIEYEYKLLLYKNLFGNSYTSTISIENNLRLDISYIFKKKQFRKDWNKKVNSSHIEIFCDLINVFYKLTGSKETISLELILAGKLKTGFLNDFHEEEIINLYKNNDGIFKKFIKETWGTRSRIVVYLDKNQEIVQIMVEEGYNNSLKEMLEIELEILKQKIFVKPSLNEEILVFQNQLHSVMILKLLEERPDFKAEMEGLKGEAKSKFESLIGKSEKEEKNKEIVQENNDQV